MLRSYICRRWLVSSVFGEEEGGEGQTESVHLNCPRNILVSEVVMRRVLLRSEVR
jgi:hypothetical protein